MDVTVGRGKKLEVRLIESFEEILFVQALPSPTLHKRREGWGSRCLGASAGVKSLGHPPNLTRSGRRFRSTSSSEQPSRGLSHASPVQCHSQWEEKRAAPPPVDRPKSPSALKTYLRWHSHFPPFAKDAKDGAPFVLPMPAISKSSAIRPENHSEREIHKVTKGFGMTTVYMATVFVGRLHGRFYMRQKMPAPKGWHLA